MNAEEKTVINTEINLGPEDFRLADQREIGIDKTFVSSSFIKDALSRFMKNKGAVFGLVMIILITICAFTGPSICGYNYRAQNLAEKNLPPRVEALEAIPMFSGVQFGVNEYEKRGLKDVYHYFGTDTLGRDLFARTWTGTRISLYVALVAILIDTIVGMSYGLISGYYGGMVDSVMQRFVEIVSTIPQTVIVTLLIVVLKPGLASITIALMLTEWVNMARIARAQTLKLKEMEFVLASKTLGARNFGIIFKDILPNIFGQVIIMCMFTIPNAIFTEAFLAFIGLGIPAPLASLGSLISEGFKSMTMYPYMVAFPVIVLALLMLSFNLMADGLRDALDPKMKEA
ncbi:MAG: ABC transporter permease [Bacillota bacterium]|nr:ABC transporter permease [Bacillota bacterium]